MEVALLSPQLVPFRRLCPGRTVSTVRTWTTPWTTSLPPSHLVTPPHMIVCSIWPTVPTVPAWHILAQRAALFSPTLPLLLLMLQALDTWAWNLTTLPWTSPRCSPLVTPSYRVRERAEEDYLLFFFICWIICLTMLLRFVTSPQSIKMPTLSPCPRRKTQRVMMMMMIRKMMGIRNPCHPSPQCSFCLPPTRECSQCGETYQLTSSWYCDSAVKVNVNSN